LIGAASTRMSTSLSFGSGIGTTCNESSSVLSSRPEERSSFAVFGRSRS
jgi:hypothetical protein